LGPEKILFWIIDLKITVIDEIIAIKAKAELKADQPNAVDEEAFILMSEQVSGCCQIPLYSSGKKVSLKENILWILHFFTQRITAGAEAIADIMEQEAGSHRIQINEADNFLCIFGKKEIGNLGVSMDNLLTYAALFAGLFQKKGILAVALNKKSTILNLRIMGSGKNALVLCKIAGCVVKSG
jgi:hypothetical protein